MTPKIHTYIINLKEREERRKSIQVEFKDKSAFNVNIVDAVKCDIGARGLWQTIQKIVTDAKADDYDMILICEDDHCFTENFNESYFRALLKTAEIYNADILLGGVSWFEDVIKIDQNLFWVSKFNGLQFTIIYKKFYESILNADFGDFDNADVKFSQISNNCIVIYPFISIQKEFGYSDVTSKNGETGWVTSLFHGSSNKIDHVDQVYNFYNLI